MTPDRVAAPAILAIETATDACSVALLAAGGLAVRHAVAPRRHAELVLAMVDEVLAEAGRDLASIGAVAFGRGPGSFTGVRIAAGVAQGLAFGADLPVVAVSTLHALAEGTRRRSGATRVLAALDARMGEVYWGAYRAATAEGALVEALPECVRAPHLVPLPDGDGWVGAGPGWEACREALSARAGAALAGVHARDLPEARDVAAIAAVLAARSGGGPPESAVPVYLRDRVAVAKAARG